MKADRIGTTRFGCGCTVHVEPDVNGIAPWLEFCERHGATGDLATELADLRRVVIQEVFGLEGGKPLEATPLSVWTGRVWDACEKAKQALTPKK